MLSGTTIGFIGGGNMAEALIRGLLQGGVSAGRILVAEPVAERRDYLAGSYGVQVHSDNREVAGNSTVLILAVKPQVAPSVIAALSTTIPPNTLLISVMAGVTSVAIEGALIESARVVRAMPNTPALALQGATAFAAGRHATEGDLALAGEIFRLVGRCWQVEERLLDAVTGLSGSGPAYVLAFIEALADAGVKNGLPRDTAMGLATQTVLGTATLLAQTGEHPAVLRDKVTSPGGTTIAGLQVLEEGGFRGTVMRAVGAATARSIELGKK